MQALPPRLAGYRFYLTRSSYRPHPAPICPRQLIDETDGRGRGDARTRAGDPEIRIATVTLSGYRSRDPISANDDDAWLLTLGLIRLFRSGVSVIVSVLREVGVDPDIASTIAAGQLDRRGKLRGFITYRIHGDHIVAMVGKIRIEFNTAHPEGFSTYLLCRHIELNGKLRRQYPQYVGVPVAKGLEQLVGRGLIRAIDPAASLFTLTQAGLERVTVGWDTFWEEIQARG